MHHHVCSYAGARAPYTGLRKAFDALMRKREAELSGGAFRRDTPAGPATVPAADMSRHLPAGTTLPLGMGIVQGILAVLAGSLTALARSADGGYGQLAVRGAGSASAYTLDWDDARPEQRFGGFVNGPTYHAAIVGLARCYAQAERPGSREVLERWGELLHALDAQFPRAAGGGPWDVHQLRAACQDTVTTAGIRQGIVRVAAALTVALHHALDTADPAAVRKLFVQYDSVLPPDVALDALDTGALLRLPWHLPAAAPAAAPDADPDADLDLHDDGVEAASETVSPEAPADALPPEPEKAPRKRRPRRNTPTPAAPTVAAPAELPVRNDRVARAVARPGHVFLFGVTATGKTTLAKHAAAAHGYGLELVVLKPGLKDDLLYGSYVRTGRGWQWQDGPVTRWARRAAAGERVALILDELARGPRDLVAGVMDLLNTYTAADVVAQRLALPAGDGPYHIVRVADTQECFVLPAATVKIIATANLGDRYSGLDLGDPAFRRRWSGGWLELAGYSDAEQRAILAHHLDLPPASTLITALLRVEQAVGELQRKDESLILPLNLALLISWGQEVRRLCAATPGTLDSRVSAAFTAAAQDLWVDMCCPLRGDRRDPDVFRALLAIVERHAPSAL